MLPATTAAAQAPIPPAAVSGLPLRSIGPALMGGRIADVAVHPRDRHTWYVAAGSGGVWKTTNAGVTFTPIFDAQPSYSIGAVAIDPAHPEIVWVGTGENVSGRHVGWGDGVYKSRDAGHTWQRMGLPQSQHIGKILIDPRDGNTVLVAAEGPLWSAGGERGAYRTTDGGATWTAVLSIDEHTGVTDLEFDPSNPDVVYAASYQRRRHVWGLLAGGASSGIHKSTDNGRTWRRVSAGLPAGDKGKIGLAVTAADPRLVYATIEANAEERGFYRSRDRGESWEKRNSYISGGTGPHYYQEIEASPVNADLVYQMDVFLQVTRDGGATFTNLESGHDKHSDNHAMWIDPADGRHMLVGTDAGLYETFDEGKRFRHFPNIPASQFYKVALSDRAPFYDVLGGAQDMGTYIGPSRTMNQDGIRNQDWYVPLGADGYGVAFEPGDPDIAYMMEQEGFLFRRDRRNEELVTIQPRGRAGDPPERWNWDSPIMVSPHQPSRVYFGSQRIWRSDDRGDRWTAISPDLTLGQERYAQRFYGRTWSVDALHDNAAMSKYATTTSISESSVAAGTLVVGTDDGLVQVTSDGGATWTRAAALPGLPALSYVNDVETSVHDARTIFVAADNHKMGDFAPYLFTSSDLGRSWRSIAGDLPRGTIVWAVQQDHVRPELLFAGTEFGVYWTPNGGTNWHKLTGGMPTTAVRDIKLHRRDNDLVAATFGRGFYVLDDYTPLRAVAAGARADGGALLPVRDAWWFVPYQVAQAAGRPELGSDDFTAENTPFGALLTVYLTELPATARESRRAAEQAQRARGIDSPFPGYDRLRAEALESGPTVLVVVSDATGRRVRTLEVPARAGLHRIAWDLRGPSPEPVRLERPAFQPPWVGEPTGPLVAPGRYSAQLVLVSASGVRELGAAQGFEVKSVPNVRGNVDLVAAAAFQERVAELARRLAITESEIGQLHGELRRVRATLIATPRAAPALHAQLDSIMASLAGFERRLSGDPARARLNQSNERSISERVWTATSTFGTRLPATATQREQAELAEGELAAVAREWRAFVDGDVARLRAALEAAGAPWTPGRVGRVP
ncbi:MAG: glycosyl hydrolase [Gemmatimonadetes bacterium]|nr:glycosyl hydrolase [Gemmatimonadota bacterium]